MVQMVMGAMGEADEDALACQPLTSRCATLVPNRPPPGGVGDPCSKVMSPYCFACTSTVFFFFFLIIYLFWLCWVLVAAHEIFPAAGRIQFSNQE